MSGELVHKGTSSVTVCGSQCSYILFLDLVLILHQCGLSFPILFCFALQSYISGAMNRWRRKHRDFIKNSDIHLKKIVLMY